MLSLASLTVVAVIALAVAIAAFAAWFGLRARRGDAPGPGTPAIGARAHGWLPVAAFGVIAFAIGAGGLQLFLARERQAESAAYRQLSAIADLSVTQIELWLGERRADGRAAGANPFVGAAVRRLLARPRAQAAPRADLLAWMDNLKTAHGYKEVSLVDADGELIVSTEAQPPVLSDALRAQTREAMRERSVTIVGLDFIDPRDESSIRIAVVAPITAGLREGEPVAAALLAHVDPGLIVFPLVESWPIASSSGETLLASVRGDAVVYLTQPRHGPALERRGPRLDDLRRVTAMLGRGMEGMLEGVDYREVRVLGAGRSVPGTPWMVLAKIDHDEVYGPIRREALAFGAVTLLLILGSGFAVLLWWRGQMLRFAAIEREARLRELTLLRHFEYLSRFANDIVLLVDDEGRVVETNDRALSAYGYAREELIGRPLSALRDAATGARPAAELESRDGVVYETVHRRRDGSTFPVELSARSIEVEGRGLTQAIIRDISSRKRSEAKLRLDALVFENARDGILITDAAGNIVSVNRAFTVVTGYEPHEVIGRNPRLLASGRHGAEFFREMWRAITERGFWQGEIWNRRKSGEPCLEWQTIAAARDDDGAVSNYVAIFSDITERKNAEDRLRFQARILDMIGESVVATDAQGRVTYWNRNAEALYGWRAEEALGRDVREMAEVHVVNPEDLAILRATPTARTGEVEIKRRDGTRCVVLMTTTPIFGESGERAGHIGVSRDITERKRAEERLAQLAQYDTLTGLPNRALFLDHLGRAMARAKRSGKLAALMFLDLDRFKEINDALGHAAGDALLRGVSARLRERLREADTIARLGGDEFTVIVESLDDRTQAELVARKIPELFSAPLAVDGREMYSSVSVGVALYPDDAGDAEELLKAADIAMYHAKQEGGNGHQMFARERHARSSERLTIETRLRTAAERGELVLVYQPRVRALTRRVVGFEALLRWHSPEFGVLPPGKFIDVAEESGLIIPVGDWVLREACRQWSQWRGEGRRPVISVNLSVRQFRRKDLVERVKCVIGEARIDPGYLEFEITETMVMRQTDEAIERLEALRALGIRISVDDFGTGHSSLAYLSRLPIDALKIDQSFVRDIMNDSDDAGIVGAIVSMGKHLDLAVIAEGVENAEQLAYLDRIGCDEYQGYYFGTPQPADRLRW